MLLTLAITVFITSLSGALMPGPVLIITVAESTRRGFIAGPLIVIGHVIVEAIVIAALLLGLGVIIQQRTVLIAIGIIGGFALIWMAYSLLNAAFRTKISLLKEVKKAKSLAYGPIIGGIVTSLSNPYFLFWWATIGMVLITSFVSLLTASLIPVIIFAISHWMSDLLWYSFVSFSISKGRQRLMSEKTYRTLIGSCGVFLLAFGAYFILDALRTILV